MAETEQVTNDSGSVFHVLGLPGADDLLLRAERLMAIGNIITERRLRQGEIGTLLGMTQSDVAALIRGNINVFSSERLAHILRDLGHADAGLETPRRK
ncbi:MAG TPA: XRE family transcriptional regulator [Sphingobium sp.]|uniref:helix-turn-helix domain-containing protein n=1 Tax=Sphingobium sp. TaxID=1912891 RepID=UPI002ED61425